MSRKLIVHSYSQADLCLTGRYRDRRNVGNNTYLVRDGDAICLTLHGHAIIEYLPDGTIAFGHCGWPTVTTMSRLNAYLPGVISVLTDGGRFKAVVRTTEKTHVPEPGCGTKHYDIVGSRAVFDTVALTLHPAVDRTADALARVRRRWFARLAREFSMTSPTVWAATHAWGRPSSPPVPFDVDRVLAAATGKPPFTGEIPSLGEILTSVGGYWRNRNIEMVLWLVYRMAVYYAEKLPRRNFNPALWLDFFAESSCTEDQAAPHARKCLRQFLLGNPENEHIRERKFI